jgi:hypothetical protein
VAAELVPSEGGVSQSVASIIEGFDLRAGGGAGDVPAAVL